MGSRGWRASELVDGLKDWLIRCVVVGSIFVLLGQY